jgi:acetoin utilization protein AcuB
MYITSAPDTTKMDLTLKINRIDLTAIIQTFVRFDYIVKAQFMEDDEMESLYSNRYEQFMLYLNI